MAIFLAHIGRNRKYQTLALLQLKREILGSNTVKQARTLTDKQLKMVLAHCATRRHAARDRCIIMFSFLAGLRAKELSALTVANVKDDRGERRDEFLLAANQTKGRKARLVYISSRLKKELETYLKSVQLRPICPALFQSQKGAAFSANTMCQLFLNIYSACGIDGASSHSGRRTFITKLAGKGVSVRVLAELAGHSSIAVTQRYIDVNEGQMKAAVELA
jgi:integrase/recombinase XerD